MVTIHAGLEKELHGAALRQPALLLPKVLLCQVHGCPDKKGRFNQRIAGTRISDIRYELWEMKKTSKQSKNG